MKLIATLLRYVIGAFGLVSFFDGLVSLYLLYSFKQPGTTFILWIFHDQPWAKVGLGVVCIAASLLMRAAIAWFASRSGTPKPPPGRGTRGRM